jgi:hypothetical protein
MKNNLVLTQVLDGLMRRYMDRVPDVQAVIRAMIAEGLITSAADIENDHIAFRTMGVAHLGIQSLEKIYAKGCLPVSRKKTGRFLVCATRTFLSAHIYK